MKYELQELENLLSQESIAHYNRVELNRATRSETNRVIHALSAGATTFSHEDHVQRYIHLHQHGVVRLMDKTEQLFSVQSGLHPADEKPCRACLEEIVNFIERYFAKYFDHDAKPPEKIITGLKTEAISFHRKLKIGLSGKSADPRLIDLVTGLFRKVYDNTTDWQITYRNVSFIKEAQKQLFRFLDPAIEWPDLNEELRQVMYCINYNAPGAWSYHTQYISELINSSETLAEKMERLAFTRKRLNQAHVKQGLGYNPQCLSLKDQLNQYITEELQYWSRFQQTPQVNSNSICPDFEDFKLEFTASVAQMAYLLRLLINTKVILNDNVSKVLSFLVKFTVTRRLEAISFGSFRSKYYATESGTKESVRTMLVSLIRYIDKN